MDEFLNQAVLAGELNLFDLQFEKALSQVNGTRLPELSLAAALASNRLASGDTCVALDEVLNLGLYLNTDLKPFAKNPPSVSQWRELLLAQRVVGQPRTKLLDEESKGDKTSSGKNTAENKPDAESLKHNLPNDHTPLVLDEKNRLYLGRYWHYEQSLLGSIERLVSSAPPLVDKKILTTGLKKLFPGDAAIDWQCVAAAMAVLRKICVITGGPGTGKTYTVAAILTLLEDQAADGKVPVIALAAPTGKAAARLTESVHGSFQKITSANKSAYHDIEAVTLHRLLGVRPGKLQPRFNRDNPLPIDTLIVDEASMVDLPLMTRTFQALPRQCRIILLGDKDQLASVESGIVLGDMCGGLKEARFSESAGNQLEEVTGFQFSPSPQSRGRIADHIVHLQKSHRSIDSGGINALSMAVNDGDSTSCLHHLNSGKFDNLTLLPHSIDNIDNVLRDTVLPVYQQMLSKKDPQQALQQMSAVCVLCALRKGRSGAEGINRRVESLLEVAGVISRDKYRDRGRDNSRNQDHNYYHGKPIMVTENNNVQNLFNGDHGLVLADQKTQELRVHFTGDDTTRAFAPGRLPEHQTFYAMTIHKSQGSEYDTVLVILPDNDSAILSRELLYTAITRARKRVIVIANEQQLRKAVETRVERQSGLLDALWPHVPKDVVVEVARQRNGESPVQLTIDF